MATTDDVYGDYRVVDVLGQGAMGMVYRAHDPRLDRRVALKLVHPSRAAAHADKSRARLVAEARALARISHPNVLAVYDIGERDDVVFVALELVDGVDLAQWLRMQKRSWSIVVDVFVAIASGLAAVHAAGMVHRDVKPANILIERAPPGRVLGRVLVADFGIARATTASVAPTLPDDIDVSPADEDTALTEAGRSVGTPAYMAPEQHLAEVVGPAADQYALCVALHEALYGRRPFLGSAKVLLRAKTQPLVEPTRSDVPKWLWTILRRGLSWRPRDRFASMEHLAAALRRESRYRRWRAPIVLTAAAAFTATAIAVAARDPVCEGADAKLAQAWNDERRVAIAEAFAASDRPLAVETWTTASARIDAHARELDAMYLEACEAAFVRREHAEDLYDRRVACLDQRKQELEQSLALLAGGDADVVDHAQDIVSALGSVAACGDLDALAAGIPPPAPSQRGAVAEVRRMIADANALRTAGRFDDAARTIAAAVALAREVDYARVIVEALVLEGEVHERQSRLDEARVALDEAIETGLEIGSDALVLRALVLRTWIAAEYERDVDAAEKWAALARAELARLGDPQVPALGLHNALGTAYVAAGRYTEALGEYEQALARVESDPELTAWTATLHSNIGGVYFNRGELERSHESYARALDLFRAQYGEDHPVVAGTAVRVAQVLGQSGRHEAAIAGLRRAIASLERMQATPSELATALTALGAALRNSGADEEASSTYLRAVELLTPTGDNASLGHALMSYGQSCVDRGIYDAAETQLQRAVVLLEPIDPTSENLAAAWIGLGRVRERQSKPDEALSFYRRAYTAAPQTRAAARALGNSALVLAATGRDDEASAFLDRQDAILAAVAIVFPNDRIGAAIARIGVATALDRASGATAPLEALERLLVQARASGGSRLSGEAELAIGRARLARGEHAQARAALERAAEELHGRGSPDLAAQAQNTLAELRRIDGSRVLQQP